MGYNSWEQFGDDLKKSIWDAVDSGDFTSLNQTVSNTIEHAVDSFTGSFRSTGQNRTQYQNGQAQQTSGYQNGQTQQNASYNRQNTGAYQTATAQNPSQLLYTSGTGTEVGGGIMIALGGVGAFCFLCVLLMLWLDPWMPWGILLIVAALALGCGAVAGAGGHRIAQLTRFRKYIGILQNREYYEVRTLAQQAGRSVQAVTKDLKKMIRRGWFKQGHLDQSGNCLMVSERSYRQYLELMEQTRRQKEEDAAQAQDRQRKQQEEAQREEARYAHLSPEVREIITSGNAYIKKVRSLNDEIPGEEVSAKISRMELLLERIFDRVEKHPESAGEMRRLMDYYLPTTVKLLEAYRDMDAQPVQPANMVSSKQEIEKTLDTLNDAFEKFLNDLFMDTAWDLSSDISVLNTMLTQDGLAGDKILK